ncbi:MAG: DUF4834 family protein [Bacteroidetes bacterium]|uniref:DUF4834 family protein n=1 Tax=Phaeocystidibacter marisrubri TaxID=1577780 RepID=A0A6L3ZI39_9FLAO|nr:DUF4834 family protein [Phaeocystidibacter marisrubri]TNE28769.1 MAG: DUF4834 family protein [Bacteroidota bacterium]
MQILRTIFFIALAWLVFRFLDRMAATRRAKSEGMNTRRPREASQSQRRERREQEVIINYDPRQTKSVIRDDVGEEVDFEEVKD